MGIHTILAKHAAYRPRAYLIFSVNDLSLIIMHLGPFLSQFYWATKGKHLLSYKHEKGGLSENIY